MSSPTPQPCLDANQALLGRANHNATTLSKFYDSWGYLQFWWRLNLLVVQFSKINNYYFGIYNNWMFSTVEKIRCIFACGCDFWTKIADNFLFDNLM